MERDRFEEIDELQAQWDDEHPNDVVGFLQRVCFGVVHPNGDSFFCESAKLMREFCEEKDVTLDELKEWYARLNQGITEAAEEADELTEAELRQEELVLRQLREQ